MMYPLVVATLAASWSMASLRFLRQIVLVESEMHRRLHHGTIVVEVDDRVGQNIDALGSAVRRQLRLVGFASRGQSLLVDLRGLACTAWIPAWAR